MQDLRDLFTTRGLLADQNGDGLADSLRVSFWLQPGLVATGLIDVCARLGLETSELDLPSIHIGTPDDERGQRAEGQWLCRLFAESAYGEAEASCTLDKERKELLLAGGSAESLNRLLRWIAACWPHAASEMDGSEPAVERIRLRGKEMILEGTDSVIMTVSVLQPQKDSKPPQIDRPRPLSSLTDLWTTAGFYQAGRVDATSKTDLFFDGVTTGPLAAACARLAARIGLASTGLGFPLTGTAGRIPELTFSLRNQSTSSERNCRVSVEQHPQDDLARVIVLEGGEDAQIAALQYFAEAVPAQEGGRFGCWEQEVIAARPSPAADELPLLMEQTWEDCGERAEMEEVFEAALRELAAEWAGQSAQGSRLLVRAFLSEPIEILNEMKERWRREIANQLAGADAQVEIISAFKPGFCWIRESVIPAVKQTGKQVGRVKLSFQPDTRPDGLELPHRWLQELYPVDQLLAQQFQLTYDQIQFEMVENQPHTYQVEVWDRENRLLGHWRLDVPVSAVPYLDGEKRAYPTTAAFYLEVNGKRVREQILATDRERFWRYYLQQFLPALEQKLLAAAEMDDSRRGVDIPLFYSIDVHVAMSEQEERLGIDEERLSSLEALHEDIYFNTLDYFAARGRSRCGVEWNAPGAVRPFVTVKPGEKPRARICVRPYRHQDVPRVQTESLLFSVADTEPVEAVVSLVSADAVDRMEWRRQDKQPPMRSKDSHPTDPLLSGWQSLRDDPSIHIWEVARSFEQRPIYAVEVTAPRVSRFYSPHKLSVFKPTILIETGHHPNEVSSMPAVRELVEEIVFQRREWLHRFNLVVIPYANPDGLVLHRELTRDNPEWKHHAARYNAVGLEYTTHRFRPTIFGEAAVVPTLFYRWLPDIVIDDHGIPSHEWTQPFAGYNSPPRFPVSYWIPISLIYGISRELDRDAYPAHAAALDEVQQAIEQKLFRDQRIRMKNKHYVDRYIRYGHKWLPEVFPLQDERELVFYRWPTKPDSSSTALIARHPEWITLDLITEAADETVYGEALRDCMTAHKLFHLGVIDWMLAQPLQIDKTFDETTLRFTRERPLNRRRQPR